MLITKVKQLYHEYGQQKSMGESASNSRMPHYFLHRTFLGENDLLVILNTKRCSHQCYFCQLPAKSSKTWIPSEDILAQFEYVLEESKHSLSVLDRITLSNEGSVLDSTTFPTDALLTIAECVHELRRVRTLVLETRLEFVTARIIREIRNVAHRVTVNILTGFETQDQYIRDKILFKNEPLGAFLAGLDNIAEAKAMLTSYVLYKPVPGMTDDEAYIEAGKTIDFLASQCRVRKIPLSIRLSPMYLAHGSTWTKLAKNTPEYQPPRLTDVMRLAEEKVQEGVPIHIGLSTEGFNETGGTYMSREDFSRRLIKPIIMFNNNKILQFDWKSLKA